MAEKDTIQKKKTTREFGVTSFAVDNRTTIFVLTIIIFVMGLVAYTSMPKEAFPEVKLPTISVSTPYPGNSPENIEKLITRPLEKEINGISSADKITSNSVQDYSSIIVEFATDMDVEEALQEVKDAIDRAKSELPTDLDQDPLANEIDFGEFPIMFINLSGEYSLKELKGYAEELKDDVEDLQEISKVNIRGIEEEEVKINLDAHKMSAVELSFQDVENAIRGRNVTMSAGNTKQDGVVTTLKIDGEFKSVKQIEDLIIKHEKGNIVYLRDILSSEIVLEPKEKESFARLDGQNVVMLDVVKGSGENILNASDQIRELTKEFQARYKGLNIVISIDQSDQTRAQVSNLENSIYSGIILVVAVLLFFLGTRNALFVGLAIPASMLLSFVILSAMGITINTMVLFGLVMALGMLVDNGIVVVENVYRLMDEGFSPTQAAKEGVGEIAWPIIASTATTLAAFIPLALWPGIMGEFMFYLPLTLIIVLGSSLFVALVINPVFTAVFMSVSAKKGSTKQFFIWVGVWVLLGLLTMGGSLGMANIFFCIAFLMLLNKYVLTPAAEKFQSGFLPRLERFYERVLKGALHGRKPILIFFGTIVFMIGTFMLFGAFQPKVLFFPDNEPNYVNVFVEMPLGTDIEVTNKFTKDLEVQVDSIIQPYLGCIKMVSGAVGAGTSDPGDPFGGGNSVTPHKARIQIEFEAYEDRKGINTTDVMKAIRDHLDDSAYPDAVVTVGKNSNGPPVGKPINIELTGPEYDQLIAYSEEVITMIKNSKVKGIEELKTDLELGKPEKRIVIDTRKAERLGVTTATVGSVIRTSLFGKEVSKYKDGEDDYPIQLRIGEVDRNDIAALMNQSITFRDQSTGKISQVPINAIASVVPDHSFGSIKRKNLDRVVTVYSNVEEEFNANEINNELKEMLADMELADDYALKFTGEQENQEKEMAFLSGALGIAAFLILIIIVAQFNRISAPAIIMTSVVFSTIGVFLGLVVFQMDFIIIMTMIGIISLAGIVVNNAIVLLDYNILLMNRKKEELKSDDRLSKEHMTESVIQSGKTRLRPVLLTAITTVLGLLPLATGLNIDFYGLFQSYNPNMYFGGENVIFWGPMSWTIIFGITFATFLTLIVLPVMFQGVERLKFYFIEKGLGYAFHMFFSWITFRLIGRPVGGRVVVDSTEEKV